MNPNYRYVMQKGHRSANKDGYVYEHIIEAERKLGRTLYPGEVVHHIDQNKRNNHPDNLMVFKSTKDHAGYHFGCEVRQLPDGAWISLYYSDLERICATCQKAFASQLSNAKYCSPECSQLAQRKCKRPTRDELESLITNSTFVSIAKKYGVSDNTVSKWCRYYGLPYRRRDIARQYHTIQ